MKTVKIKPTRGNTTIVSFGPTLMSDPASKYTIYELQYDKKDPSKQPKFEVFRQGPMPKKGRLRLELKHGMPCMVLAQGDDVAGMIHTAGEEIRAPFYLAIDADPSDKALREKQIALNKQKAEQRPNMIAQAVRWALNAGRRKR